MSKETPIFKNKEFSKTNIIVTASGGNSYVDTKTLLSDHIKKHIRAVRNNNISPQTEKPLTKSCNRTTMTCTVELKKG